MINLIRSEWFKIRKVKGINIIFAAAWGSAAALFVMTYLAGRGTIGAEANDLHFMLCETQMMTLLGGLMAATLICGDFDNKTVQAAVSAGHDRLWIIGSRMISYAITVLIIILPYVVMTLLVYCLGIEIAPSAVPSVFLELASEGAARGFSVDVLMQMIGIMLFLGLIYAAQLTICVFLTFVFRKTVPVIGISYAVSLFSGTLLSWENTAQRVKDILAWTPFSYGYGKVALGMEAAVIAKGLTSGVIMVSVILLMTWCVFRKAEIK